MNRRKPLLLILLVLACAIWLYNISLFVRRGPHGVKVKPATMAVAPPNYVYKADIRDPFYFKQFMSGQESSAGKGHGGRKTGMPKVLPPQCKIGGIVYNPGNSMAIFLVGGKSQLVKQGDVVDSIEVKKIFRDSVLVVFKGKRFSLAK